MITRRSNPSYQSADQIHAQAWRDEYADRAWPQNPDAVYQLARARAREARQNGQMIRAILRFMNAPKAKCT
jgi:hypothetical protein